jgi:hypothetical protein
MSGESRLIFSVGGFLLCGAFGAIVGSYRGNETTGLWLGIFLGPIGILITALLPDNRKQTDRGKLRFTCPLCEEPFDISDSDIGTNVTCDHCEEVITIPKLQTCPDCAKKVSRRASACPECGCPL